MATVANNSLGLVEIAKRTNNNQVLTVHEALSRVDDFLEDMILTKANQVSAYVHTRRTSQPSGSWRKIGTGANTESSHTKQIVENIGTLESWSETDELTIKKMLGDRQAFLNTEFISFVEGMGQTISTAFVTSDTQVNPEQFDGMQIRLNSLGTQVKGAGGSGGDTTSVYGIHWGPQAVTAIYEPDLANPAGNVPVAMDNKGLQTVEDGSSTTPTRRDVFQAKFQASMGLAIHDDRDIFRLTNIENDTAGANIVEPDLLIQLMRQGRKGGQSVPGGEAAPQWILYMHQSVLIQLDILAMDKSNVLYSPDGMLWGAPVTSFRGAPLRQLDAIGTAETAVA